jgi:hypothetical protein
MTHAKEILPDVIPDIREQLKAVQFELSRLMRGITALMTAIGADPAQCKGCKQRIYFIRHANGKATPYDADGTNHFITCPHPPRKGTAKE